MLLFFLVLMLLVKRIHEPFCIKKHPQVKFRARLSVSYLGKDVSRTDSSVDLVSEQSTPMKPFRSTKV